MTIVSAVKTRDCLVMGTDSLSTQITSDAKGQINVVKSYSHTPKLFELTNRPIGISTWGVGNIDNRSIGGLVSEFSDSLTQQTHTTVQAVATQLCTFINLLYSKSFSNIAIDKQPILGFFVGGYSNTSPLAEMWVVRFPMTANSCAQLIAPQYFGATWEGVPLPFYRLQKGIDSRITDKLKQLGVLQQEIDQATQGMESSVIFDSMPVKQAIDYCKFILNTTIGFSQFEVGVPVCGEPLQVAFITQKGFKWVEELTYHW